MGIGIEGMGINSQAAIQSTDEKGAKAVCTGMAEKVHFSCEEHETSFDRLTDRQKQFIAAYMRSGSPTKVAKELGLKGSVKGVGKRISQIAKIMGLSGARELRPQKNSEASVTAADLMKKIRNQNFKCALSGIKLTPENAQLDHIEPLSEGGTNAIDNLQWLDARVNKAKGTMSQDEFVDMCERICRKQSRMPPAGD